MTNYEKFKDSLTEPLCRFVRFGVDKESGCPKMCCSLTCLRCKFGKGYTESPFCSKEEYCEKNRLRWLLNKYTEPPVDWRKVKADTPVLVSNGDNIWVKRHFAYVDKWNRVWTFPDGLTSWTGGGLETVVWEEAKLGEEEK